MIIFKWMRWGNAFSYADDNYIDFTQPLVQLIGKNGNGKSSIALILEECLFNKNSKGVKKSDILNRYVASRTYKIEVCFEKDGAEYKVTTVRGGTQTVKLEVDGVDVSEHTSTATYKTIESVLGYDHKTFTQIVYQSGVFNLEFLKTTDTARKRFFIDLFNLDVYTEIADKVKADLKDTTNSIEALESKLRTYESWLQKYSKENLEYRAEVAIPARPDELSQQLAEVNQSLLQIQTINAKIAQNNTYIKVRNGIVLEMVPAPTSDILQLKIDEATLADKSNQLNKVIKGTGPIISKCPSCGQAIDTSHKSAMVDEARAKLQQVDVELSAVRASLRAAEKEHRGFNEAKANIAEWEKYSSLIDPSLSTEPLNKQTLVDKINDIKKAMDAVNKDIAAAETHNREVTAHNTKVDVLRGQKASIDSEKEEVLRNIAVVKVKLESQQLLAKTFSPTGFTAYKIDYLAKDLEDATNKYLQEMSDGRFTLEFKISSSDKLDVVINDNGTDIDISALSNGELARVNISTLLGIRSLMQSLSNTRTNLLILDETIEYIDPDGKDKLVEMLLKEPHLNTVLVSHGFTHPLITKLDVIKENNISRIER